MAKESNPASSLEGTTTRIDLFEDLIDRSEDGSAATEVAALQEFIREESARALAEMMTGRRGSDEVQDAEDWLGEFIRILWLGAFTIAIQALDEGCDTDEAKRRACIYLEASIQELVERDYELRLDNLIERSKKHLALNPKQRFGAAMVASAMTSTLAVQGLEMSPHLSVTHETQSLVGAAPFVISLGYYAVKSAVKNGPPRLGLFFSNRVNITVGPYLPPDGFAIEGGVDAGVLIKEYAKRHTERAVGKLLGLTKQRIESRDDIVPMLDSVLDEVGSAIHESYGLDPEDDTDPSYRRWLSQTPRVKKLPKTS